MREEYQLIEILKMVAPGTKLRDGLDNVLRANTGALIVIGDTEEVREIMDGGFAIDCDLTPANLYELAKMDGSIIISEDCKKITMANVLLVPNPSIQSVETGIRHRTAERVARQTGQLVISISQRRDVITLYKGNWRYSLKEIAAMLSKANQAIQTLDKYKTVLDRGLMHLSALEFDNIVTFGEVASVIQRIEMVLRIKEEIEKYIVELGTEGRLISMQMEELVAGVELESYLVVKDYYKGSDDIAALDVLRAELKELSADELLDTDNIIDILGYEVTINISEKQVQPRGYRALTKVPRIPISVIDNVIKHFGILSDVVQASVAELDKIEGIGEVRARLINDGLRRIREQAFFERHI